MVGYFPLSSLLEIFGYQIGLPEFFAREVPLPDPSVLDQTEEQVRREIFHIVGPVDPALLSDGNSLLSQSLCFEGEADEEAGKKESSTDPNEVLEKSIGSGSDKVRSETGGSASGSKLVNTVVMDGKKRLKSKVAEPKLPGDVRTVIPMKGGQGYAMWMRTKRGFILFKVLHPRESVKEVQLLEREIGGVKRLPAHPNIVRTLGAHRKGDILTIAQDPIPGRNLKLHIEERKKRPEYRGGPVFDCAEVMRLMCETAQAGRHLHKHGLVHGDWKPENVIWQEAEVDANGRLRPLDRRRAKLSDFGMSVWKGGQEGAGGTPGYMPPEVQQKRQVPDKQSDVFSWGAMAYEWLAGEKPFAVVDEKRTVYDALEAKDKLPTGNFWDGMVALVLRCLEVDPRNRPKDMAEVDKLLRLTLGKRYVRPGKVDRGEKRRLQPLKVEAEELMGTDLMSDPQTFIKAKMEDIVARAKEGHTDAKWLEDFRWVCEFSRRQKSYSLAEKMRLFDLGVILEANDFSFTKDLSGLIFAGVLFRGLWEGVSFRGSDFLGATFLPKPDTVTRNGNDFSAFHHCDLRDIRSYCCSVVGPDAHDHWKKIDFQYCRYSSLPLLDLVDQMTQERFSALQREHCLIGPRAILTEQTLPEMDLSGMDLSKADFTKADLRKVKLRGANLKGATLREANLSGVDLRGANLEGVELSYSTKFEGANLSNANLKGCTRKGASYIQSADLSGACLDGARLDGGSFDGSNLRGASLKYARVDGKRFGSADLTGADLSGTDLQGSDLSKAVGVYECTMTNAVANRKTVWPKDGPPKGQMILGVDKEIEGKLAFEDVVITDADLSETKISGAVFKKVTIGEGCDVSGMNIWGGSIFRESFRMEKVEGKHVFIGHCVFECDAEFKDSHLPMMMMVAVDTAKEVSLRKDGLKVMFSKYYQLNFKRCDVSDGDFKALSGEGNSGNFTAFTHNSLNFDACRLYNVHLPCHFKAHQVRDCIGANVKLFYYFDSGLGLIREGYEEARSKSVPPVWDWFLDVRPQMDLGNQEGFESLHFPLDGYDLNDVNFAGKDLSKASFKGANLCGADFSKVTKMPEAPVAFEGAVYDEYTKWPVVDSGFDYRLMAMLGPRTNLRDWYYNRTCRFGAKAKRRYPLDKLDLRWSRLEGVDLSSLNGVWEVLACGAQVDNGTVLPDGVSNNDLDQIFGFGKDFSRLEIRDMVIEDNDLRGQNQQLLNEALQREEQRELREIEEELREEEEMEEEIAFEEEWEKVLEEKRQWYAGMFNADAKRIAKMRARVVALDTGLLRRAAPRNDAERIKKQSRDVRDRLRRVPGRH